MFVVCKSIIPSSLHLYKDNPQEQTPSLEKSGVRTGKVLRASIEKYDTITIKERRCQLVFLGVRGRD